MAKETVTIKLSLESYSCEFDSVGTGNRQHKRLAFVGNVTKETDTALPLESYSREFGSVGSGNRKRKSISLSWKRDKRDSHYKVVSGVNCLSTYDNGRTKQTRSRDEPCDYGRTA